MRIDKITARTLRWPIAGRGAARGRSERIAIIVEVRGEAGVIGLGEAAPLPGMSRDTLAGAERALAGFAAQAPFAMPADRDAATALAAEAAPDAPAAQHAIETALCDAVARAHARSLAQLVAAPAACVPLAAVVDDAAAAARAFATGIRCFKIKLAAGDDPARVFAIAAAVPGARLRIDANQSWPRDEVPARLAQLAQLPIEFVEEPCDATHELLGEPLACRLALDESLAVLSAGQLAAALAGRQLAAVVLKPTLLGGISRALALAGLARRAGVAAVASHALEGPIGTAACAEFALALGPAAAAGLAAHPGLTGWRIEVAQLTPHRVHSLSAAGLGFVDLDLAGVVRAAPPGDS